MKKGVFKHLNISLIIKILLVLHGKHLSDDNIREMLLLLKKIDMIPTAIAKQFNFTLPALSSHLRILKDSDLIADKKKGKNSFYSLNRNRTLELVEFFGDMYDYNLKSLKEYVESKEKKNETITKKITWIVAFDIYPWVSWVRMMKTIIAFPGMVTQWLKKKRKILCK